MAIWFVSDWHFNHNREFIYKQRGFNSIEEMNQAIIERHNSVVKPEDIVYCLGDCCLGGSNEQTLLDNKNLIEQLNGQIHIIRGNHDTDNRVNMYKTCKNVVEADKWADFIKYSKYHFYLSHYPTNTSNLENNAPLSQHCIGIYGHSHQKTNFYNDVPYMYHIGVDSHDCYPVNIEQILTDIRAKIEECKDVL